jgi:hypothetical protein
MALIVEDGTGVANANSYISLVDARAWAVSRGLTLSAVDATLESALIRAMDFVESQRSRFSGAKTSATQALQWPRTGASLDGVELEATVIPAELKSAQVQLAFEAQTADLQPTGTGQEVLREKIDVIETQYAERGAGSVVPQFNKAMAFLEPLFKSGGFGISVVRI